MSKYNEQVDYKIIHIDRPATSATDTTNSGATFASKKPKLVNTIQTDAASNEIKVYVYEQKAG